MLSVCASRLREDINHEVLNAIERSRLVPGHGGIGTSMVHRDDIHPDHSQFGASACVSESGHGRLNELSGGRYRSTRCSCSAF